MSDWPVRDLASSLSAAVAIDAVRRNGDGSSASSTSSSPSSSSSLDFSLSASVSLSCGTSATFSAFWEGLPSSFRRAS